MSLRRSILSVALATAVCVALLPVTGCGTAAPLDKSVEFTEVQSGYVDMGLVNGETKLVPYASLRIKNIGTAPLDGFQLSASFWRVGEDGQKDEMQLPHLVAKNLAPGAVSDRITIRANFGYTLAGARADFFAHSMFVDFTIKVFGKISGRMYRVGEVSVERKIVPKDAVVPTT
jgi:hypothetical protein